MRTRMENPTPAHETACYYDSPVYVSRPHDTFELMTPTLPPKTALVTGSGKRRVGWHVAEALARRGYRLAVHYRSSAAEAAESLAYFQSLGAEALGFQADLTDEDAVR